MGCKRRAAAAAVWVVATRAETLTLDWQSKILQLQQRLDTLEESFQKMASRFIADMDESFDAVVHRIGDLEARCTTCENI